MRRVPELKLEVPTEEVFQQLLADEVPLRLRSTPLRRGFHRDTYFDTSDATLAQRGIRCRVRTLSEDRRVLSVQFRDLGGVGIASHHTHTARVPDVDPMAALHGTSEPARRLRGVIDPARLGPVLELETERYARRARRAWWQGWLFELAYDAVTVRGDVDTHVFRELKIRHRRRGRPSLDELVRALQERYPLRPTLIDKVDRGQKMLATLEARSHPEEVQRGREVAVIASHEGEIALLRSGNTLALPVGPGSGEEACRTVLRQLVLTDQGKVGRIGIAAGSVSRPPMEVWLADDLPRAVVSAGADRVQWFTVHDIISRVGSPLLRDARTLAALAVARRSNLVPTAKSSPARTAPTPHAGTSAEQTHRTIEDLQRPDLPETSLDAAQQVPDQFVNVELSWLEFNARVLEMAEDDATPLLARFRFLSIFSSNLDEFFMVRVGTLKHAVAQGVSDRSVDGLTPQEQLDAISVRLAPLLERQQRCFADLLPELERHGFEVKRWTQLAEPARQELRDYFEQQVFPTLTPQAMTQAPGHPFPHIGNLSVSLAAIVRDEVGGPIHFAHIRIPSGLPRFVPVPGETGVFAPIDDVISANLAALYPGRLVEAVHAFRITRSGDIQVNEEAAADLLQAIEEEVKRRPFGGVVRLEIDAAMPAAMRELLERELRLEDVDNPNALAATDIYEAEVLIDLTSSSELASLPVAGQDYPGFTPRELLDPRRSIFDIIAAQDVLVYHPYDAFESTVERFIVEAADDPHVVAIKLTLYRSGSQSAIIDALTRAAAAEKDVSVFVELKARFDEERNITWARKLEQAGIHVVYGLVRLKTHAKTTLIVRREGDELRRYVHIGTGNYNSATAKFYTDLGMLSCRPKLGADLSDLFNELTGSSRPPQSKFRRLLVAPKRMRRRFLKLIEREAAHARAGRGGRIQVKMNGIADTEIVGALYEASQAGVDIDLFIRGICALRPGVPGLSERIRVVSILGRFLEHARIYYFANAGEPEYFIGSADWRPRNLRRRVEVVTPVTEADARAKLDRILELELNDPCAWQMNSDGSYARRPRPIGPKSAQEYWIEQLAAVPTD